MDGDVAPLKEISRLALAHEACLIADDAHATGILGAAGSGLSAGADIVIGTFSKALGGFGAYVASSATTRNYLINRCSGLIYSTALPPPVLGAMDAALDLVPGMDADRAYVAKLAARFRSGAQALGYDTAASATQIVPLICGAPESALHLGERLRQSGFWATPIRPPTVPKGTARVRLAFTRGHTESDVDLLLEAIADTANSVPMQPRARAHPA
jgi:8-amino-7-oxononanoate synthase